MIYPLLLHLVVLSNLLKVLCDSDANIITLVTMWILLPENLVTLLSPTNKVNKVGREGGRIVTKVIRLNFGSQGVLIRRLS